jgi:hypothetical protein
MALTTLPCATALACDQLKIFIRRTPVPHHRLLRMIPPQFNFAKFNADDLSYSAARSEMIITGYGDSIQ